MKKEEGLYMVTTIISGKVKERRKSRIMRRPSKRGGRIRGNSSERKIEGNREYAVLQLTRTLNCNMKANDVWLTLTFSDEALTACGGTFEDAKAEAKKFVDRCVYRRRKQGVVTKWVIAPSEIDGETGELVRPHVHVIMNGEGFSFADGVLRLFDEDVERIWGKGSVDVQFLRHQDDYYPLAKYIISQSRNVPDEKKYSVSRNMEKPVVRREIVHSGAQLRLPTGATELPGTKYDPEKGQNIVRYVPRKKNPARQVGGHKEMTLSKLGEEGDDDGL